MQTETAPLLRLRPDGTPEMLVIGSLEAGAARYEASAEARQAWAAGQAIRARAEARKRQAMELTFISLFAGIGGIDLGLERAGMQCVAQVEIDDYANRVLAKHWPNVPRFKDVREVGTANLPSADVIAGGFPCQPHSLAGKRQASNDERDLWGEYARIIGEIRPRWVVAENVPGLLSSDDGRFFGGVLRDLARLGYDAEWHSLRASDLGAPHQRERVFVIAYPRGQRIQRQWPQQVSRVEAFSWCQDVGGVEDLRKRSDLPASLVWGNRNGIPDYVDRIRCLGNSVVPQAAELIGRWIVSNTSATVERKAFQEAA